MNFVDLKVQQALSQVTASTGDVNRVGSETSRLVSNVSHVVAEWDTWFNRATTAQQTIDEMTSEAEMTTSRARDMLSILVDFDARSEGWCSLCVACCYCAPVKHGTVFSSIWRSQFIAV